MAKNPMQRKAQNSFLIGMLVTLLVTGLIIAFLILQLTKSNNEIKEMQGNKVKICVLSANVTSGQTITDDMIKTIEVDKNTVPSNSFGSDISVISTYSLEDSAGNSVLTYINEETKENYLYIPETDETTGQIKNRVIEPGSNGVDYYYQDTKAKVELTTVPLIAKVDMTQNTILTSSLIVKSDERITNDLRKQEYNMIVLPSQIETGGYVDVRLRMPDGTDFIVASHKQIEIPETETGPSATTIWMNLTETEIVTMSGAIVESYRVPGSLLYLSQYVEAGMQEAATKTYIPSDDILNLIRRDPNCVNEAKQELFNRNNDANTKSAVRNPINNYLNKNQDDLDDNVIDNVEDEIKKIQEERQSYLESLGG